MSELNPQEIEYLALYELEQEQQAINANRTASLSHDINKAELIKFLLVLFAYGWWFVIVVYFGLLSPEIGIYYRLISLPTTVIALGLVVAFHMAIKQHTYFYAGLFFSGLLVAGMLS